MTDAWTQNGKLPDKEFTYDYFTNYNLQTRSIKLKRRIDKILFRTKGSLNLIDFNLIKGCKQFIQPSDHHGISCTFAMNVK